MKVGIVGTGPAGCAAAISLCQKGCEVFLVGDGKDSVGEHLHPAARSLLQHLGFTDLPGQIECVGVRSAWHSLELAEQNYLGHPFGNGWLLDRKSFGRTLRQRVAALGAELIEPSRLVNLTQLKGRRRGWRLQLSHRVEECDWVVDASGRVGAVARLLGVRRRRMDCGVAVVGWLATEADGDQDQTLLVEKTDGGWWYGCRLPQKRRVAGFVSSSSINRSDWESKLRSTRHLGYLVEQYELICPLVTRPADSTILEHCYGMNWIAIGDAAVSYDPLASRGLFSALQAGIEVASLIGASVETLNRWQANLQSRFAGYLNERQRWINSEPMH